MSKTYGFDEFINKFENMQKEYKKQSIELLEETGDEAVAEIQMRTPVDTGTLRRSMARERVNTNDMSVRVGTSIHYAKYVEFGHRVGRMGFVPGQFMIRDGATVAQRNFRRNGIRMMRDIVKEFR